MGFNMAKKNSKSSKGSKEQEKTVAKKSKTILKRKQLRKDKRQAKKTARREFLIKKVKGNRPRSQADDEEIPSDDEVGVKKPPKAKKAVVQKPPSDHDKMKKDMKELKRQQKKQRKTQLLAANEAEEKSIKMLEKNLGLKRRKSKNLPKSFLDDGLDYLLDACDSSKIAAFEKEIQEENHLERMMTMMTMMTQYYVSWVSRVEAVTVKRSKWIIRMNMMIVKGNRRNPWTKRRRMERMVKIVMMSVKKMAVLLVLRKTRI